ncbi:MAG: glycosyltransferase [Oscillospiraceae bacterium]|jgi:glycosyltransferase involved in cell wall biosynthesis|nr:glycosyltransferase [Oscillospiraceae bacterium]
MSVYAQFTDAYAPIRDGVSTLVHNYATHLNRAGHRTLVVAPGVPNYEETDPFEVVRMRSLLVPPRKPYRLQLPTFSPSSRRRLDRTGFDLVHAHSPLVAGAEALRVARRQNIPLVVTFHSKMRDDFAQAVHSDWLAGAINKSVMRFYDKADAVWTVNQSTLGTMREYGFQGRVDVVPIGCDMVGHPRDRDAAAAFIQAQYGISPDVPLLLFVGQMTQVKNPMLVVSAYAELARRGSPCHLLMVGEGGYLQALQDQAMQLGVAEKVHFAGVLHQRDALASCYTRADLFVFPSRYDNAPLVVREASAMACPSLLLRGTNAAEGVTHGENGFLAETDSLLPFTQALTDVLADPARMRAAGERARDTLAFAWENVAGEVAARYADIQREFIRRPTRRRSQA